MRIKEYEKDSNIKLMDATIMLLLRESEILLAMKKRGFGVGKWNGVGGKPETDEDILVAAIRESEEGSMLMLDGSNRLIGLLLGGEEEVMAYVARHNRVLA